MHTITFDLYDLNKVISANLLVLLVVSTFVLPLILET